MLGPLDALEWAKRCCESSGQREGRAYLDDYRRTIRKDQLRRKTKHGEPNSNKRPIPPRVRTAPLRMMATVDFNHQPSRQSKEVNDEGLHDDLPPKLHAKLARAERQPEHPLGL